MALTRWDPFADVLDLQRSFNRFLEDSWRQGRPGGDVGQMTFPVDIYETPEELVVRAELPGVSLEDISVQMMGSELVIKTDRKPQEVPEDAAWIRNEMRHGTFSRAFRLGTRVNDEKIAATYADGVLTVTLPKAEEVKPRQIPVQNVKAIGDNSSR